jgi:uncharacterized iron-regulated membrane protein
MRNRPQLQLIALGLYVIAGVVWLVSNEIALLLYCVATVYMVGLQVVLWRHHRDPTPPAPLSEALASQLREERDRAGEIAAITALRAQRPELSLPQAVQAARDLPRQAPSS